MNKIEDLLPTDSWFRDWMTIWPHAEAPRNFILFAGMSMLGAALGRRIWVDFDYHKLYPMLNTLFLGPSGIGKSTAITAHGLPLIWTLPVDKQPQIIGSTTKEKLHFDLRPKAHAILVASELANFFSKEKYKEALIPYVCLPPDVPILTEDLQWKPVGDLKVKDKLLAFDEMGNKKSQGRRLRRSTVVATGKKILPCYKISTNKGEIIASEAHGFLRKIQHENHVYVDRWIPAKELKAGDFIRYFGNPWKENNTKDAGYLAGLFDGEGCVSKYRVSFNQNRGEVLDKGFRLLKEQNFEPKTHLHGTKAEVKDETRVVAIDPLYNRLHFLGSIRPVRLLKNAWKCWEGRRISGRVKNAYAKVESNLYVGNKEVVTLQTTTKTMISAGYFTHNTELLDYNEKIEVRTMSGENIEVWYPAVTVIGGSTVEWLQRQLPDSASTGGFLARFLIVTEEHKGQRVALPALSMGKRSREKLLKRREQVFHDFSRLPWVVDGEMKFLDFGAADVYNEWYSNLKAPTGIMAPFMERAKEFVMRFAMLLAVSCQRGVLTAEDITSGIALYEAATKRLHTVLIPYSQEGRLLLAVMNIIGTSTMTDAEVYSHMKPLTTAQKTAVMIDSLLQSQDLVRTTDKKLKKK